MAKKAKPVRLGSNPPAAELRKFRRDIAELQRRGLLPGAKIKASTARPLQIRGGQHLKDYVKAYKSVLTGHAAAVQLPREAVIEQHKMGRKTVRGTGSIGGRVIIPKAPDERVVVTKSGAVKRVDIPSGLTVIDLPTKFLNKEERKRALEVANEMGGGRKYWGYKMAGHRGNLIFESPKALFNHLKRQYKTQIQTYGWNKFHDTISILSSDNDFDLKREEGRPR